MSDVLRRPLDKLGDDVSLFDLDIDSIDIFEMVCEFETKYKVEIPNEGLDRFVIVGDAVDALQKLLPGYLPSWSGNGPPYFDPLILRPFI